MSATFTFENLSRQSNLGKARDIDFQVPTNIYILDTVNSLVSLVVTASVSSAPALMAITIIVQRRLTFGQALAFKIKCLRNCIENWNPILSTLTEER